MTLQIRMHHLESIRDRMEKEPRLYGQCSGSSALLFVQNAHARTLFKIRICCLDTEKHGADTNFKLKYITVPNLICLSIVHFVSNQICPVDVSGRVCTYVSVQCPVCPLWTGSLAMALW